MLKAISDAWGYLARRLPELVLGFFFLSLVPLAALLLRGAYRQVTSFVESPGAYVSGVQNAPRTAVAVLVCLIGVVGVAWLMARNWGPVWAVARKLIQEAVNRWVVIVLLIFFAVLMPSLPFLLKSEGNLASQVQLVVLYSLALALVLLSLVAIFLTTASVCSEVEQKQVHITDTKPLPRWQFLFGKWFGTVVMCTAVLCLMTAGTVGLVFFMTRPRDLSKLAPLERTQAEKDRWQLANEVFVARRSYPWPLPDVTEVVEERAREWLAEQHVAQALYSYKQDTQMELWRQAQYVRQGEMADWRFSGLGTRRTGPVQVRFKAFSHTGLGIAGQFVAFFVRPSPDDPNKVIMEPVAGLAPVWSPSGGWARNSFHEFSLPASVIAEDGTVNLRFMNWGGAVTFEVDPPIELLQGEEGFLLNYYRSLAIIMCQIALLAALGLMAGSLFSFPVASLLVICMFVGGLLAPWFRANFVVPDIYTKVTPTTVYIDRLWRGFAGLIVALMPDFGTFSPLGNVSNGRLVSLGDLSEAASVLLFVKGGAAVAVGVFFYARRELARVIV